MEYSRCAPYPRFYNRTITPASEATRGICLIRDGARRRPTQGGRNTKKAEAGVAGPRVLRGDVSGSIAEKTLPRSLRFQAHVQARRGSTVVKQARKATSAVSVNQRTLEHMAWWYPMTITQH